MTARGMPVMPFSTVRNSPLAENSLVAALCRIWQACEGRKGTVHVRRRAAGLRAHAWPVLSTQQCKPATSYGQHSTHPLLQRIDACLLAGVVGVLSIEDSLILFDRHPAACTTRGSKTEALAKTWTGLISTAQSNAGSNALHCMHARSVAKRSSWRPSLPPLDALALVRLPAEQH